MSVSYFPFKYGLKIVRIPVFNTYTLLKSHIWWQNVNRPDITAQLTGRKTPIYLLTYLFVVFVSVSFFHRPDMTVMVDWALKINQFICCGRSNPSFRFWHHLSSYYLKTMIHEPLRPYCWKTAGTSCGGTLKPIPAATRYSPNWRVNSKRLLVDVFVLVVSLCLRCIQLTVEALMSHVL